MRFSDQPSLRQKHLSFASSTTTHGDSHSCDSLSIDSLEHIVFVFTLRPPFARSQSQTSFSDGFHRGKRTFRNFAPTINNLNGIKICRALFTKSQRIVLTYWLLQVLRYSALGAGIFYGIYHQAKLSSASKLAAINREYEHKQSLINQAKAEFSKKNAPASAKTASGGSTFYSRDLPFLSACPSRKGTAIAVQFG